MAEGFLRIGELAERAGVSADSVRHYERLGLLPAADRTDGGYRLFPPAAVERVQLIPSAVRVGFSLRQLAAFLGERQAGGAPCRKVRDAAQRGPDGALEGGSARLGLDLVQGCQVAGEERLQ